VPFVVTKGRVAIEVVVAEFFQYMAQTVAMRHSYANLPSLMTVLANG
jgi:hypothetical protein